MFTKLFSRLSQLLDVAVTRAAPVWARFNADGSVSQLNAVDTMAALGAGAGDVVGPASATDNAVVRYDSTTGKLVQNSTVTISDDGSIVASGIAATYVNAARQMYGHVLTSAAGVPGASENPLRITNLAGFQTDNNYYSALALTDPVIQSQVTLGYGNDTDGALPWRRNGYLDMWTGTLGTYPMPGFILTQTNNTASYVRYRVEATGTINPGDQAFYAAFSDNPVDTLQLKLWNDGTTSVGNGIIHTSILTIGGALGSTVNLNGATASPTLASKPGVYHRSGVGLGVFSDASISFEVNGSGTLADAMRIFSTGKVTVGSTSSTADFQVGAIGTVKDFAVGMENTFMRFREYGAVNDIGWTTNMSATPAQDDASKSSWKVGMGATADSFTVARAPAGSTTFATLFTVSSAGAVSGTSINANTVTVADTTDATCSVALFESPTGDQGPKTDAGITYNASSGTLTVTGSFNAGSSIVGSLFAYNFGGGSRFRTIAVSDNSVVDRTTTLVFPDAATTITFPATTCTLARTDAAQTFTGTQTFNDAVIGVPMRVTAQAKSADFTVAVADKGVLFPISTGSGSQIVVTLPAAATAGNGWFCYLQKVGGTTRSFITSPATVVVNANNQTIKVWTDGSSYYAESMSDGVLAAQTFLIYGANQFGSDYFHFDPANAALRYKTTSSTGFGVLFGFGNASLTPQEDDNVTYGALGHASRRWYAANIGTGGLTVTGASTLTGGLIGGVQSLSGPGAVNVTTLTTALTSTGVGDALTLANGTAGQIKTIVHDVDGGSAVLTPTTKTGFTTVTFTNAGDTVTLQYFTTRGWMVIASHGAVVA